MKRTLTLLAVALFFATACSTKKSADVELVIDSQSDLGEGAIWNYKTGELMWINITGEVLNIYNPNTGNNKEMFTGQMIGTVVPAESGDVIVALQNGFYRMNTQTGSKELIIDPEADIPMNRFNDGKCDPSGRFWAGTMHVDELYGKGSLYRLDAESSVNKMIDSVTISNGIVWSNDFKKMYYIDTPTRKVMGYDFDNATGEISNPTVAVEIPPSMGAPDGMTIDADGNVWVALWGGSAVGCWNPETGELVRKIDVPAKNITSCAFGDDDLGTLYITSARRGTSPEALEQFPQSGGVFKTRPGVKGVKAYFFDDEN
ncbi:MAG TPA: SMP-30/gluconolactonase/LRE family protein [Draconibacterium sp.]|nr:SMP-30/gluconolactonase/LRE family protein [Draconibacterium sp.]